VAVLVLLAPLVGAPSVHAASLRAGAGKADITPRTGYYLGGWTRQDRVAQGQHTRLWSRALVLQRGDRKVGSRVPEGPVRRIERATFAWRGGPDGLDRPVGRAFVVVQRRVKRRWRTVDSDLGLGML
jgi:hypothetical protein